MKIKLLLFTAALLLGACAPREGFSRADEALLREKLAESEGCEFF